MAATEAFLKKSIMNMMDEDPTPGIVKVVGHIDGSEEEGRVVKEVADSSVYMTAIFQKESLDILQQSFEDSFNSPPDWSHALILLNEYCVDFQPASSPDNKERKPRFVLVIKRFGLVNLHLGCYNKCEPRNVMADQEVQAKAREMETRYQSQAGPEEGSSQEDVPLSLLLEKLGEQSSDPPESSAQPEEQNDEDPREVEAGSTKHSLQSALEAMCCLDVENFIVSTSQQTVLDSLPAWKDDYIPQSMGSLQEQQSVDTASESSEFPHQEQTLQHKENRVCSPSPPASSTTETCAEEPHVPPSADSDGSNLTRPDKSGQELAQNSVPSVTEMCAHPAGQAETMENNANRGEEASQSVPLLHDTTDSSRDSVRQNSGFEHPDVSFTLSSPSVCEVNSSAEDSAPVPTASAANDQKTADGTVCDSLNTLSFDKTSSNETHQPSSGNTDTTVGSSSNSDGIAGASLPSQSEENSVMEDGNPASADNPSLVEDSVEDGVKLIDADNRNEHCMNGPGESLVLETSFETTTLGHKRTHCSLSSKSVPSHSSTGKISPNKSPDRISPRKSPRREELFYVPDSEGFVPSNQDWIPENTQSQDPINDLFSSTQKVLQGNDDADDREQLCIPQSQGFVPSNQDWFPENTQSHNPVNDDLSSSTQKPLQGPDDTDVREQSIRNIASDTNLQTRTELGKSNDDKTVMLADQTNEVNFVTTRQKKQINKNQTSQAGHDTDQANKDSRKHGASGKEFTEQAQQLGLSTESSTTGNRQSPSKSVQNLTEQPEERVPSHETECVRSEGLNSAQSKSNEGSNTGGILVDCSGSDEPKDHSEDDRQSKRLRSNRGHGEVDISSSNETVVIPDSTQEEVLVISSSENSMEKDTDNSATFQESATENQHNTSAGSRGERKNSTLRKIAPARKTGLAGTGDTETTESNSPYKRSTSQKQCSRKTSAHKGPETSMLSEKSSPAKNKQKNKASENQSSDQGADENEQMQGLDKTNLSPGSVRVPRKRPQQTVSTENNLPEKEQAAVNKSKYPKNRRGRSPQDGGPSVLKKNSSHSGSDISEGRYLVHAGRDQEIPQSDLVERNRNSTQPQSASAPPSARSGLKQTLMSKIWHRQQAVSGDSNKTHTSEKRREQNDALKSRSSSKGAVSVQEERAEVEARDKSGWLSSQKPRVPGSSAKQQRLNRISRQTATDKMEQEAGPSEKRLCLGKRTSRQSVEICTDQDVSPQRRVSPRAKGLRLHSSPGRKRQTVRRSPVEMFDSSSGEEHSFAQAGHSSGTRAKSQRTCSGSNLGRKRTVQQSAIKMFDSSSEEEYTSTVARHSNDTSSVCNQNRSSRDGHVGVSKRTGQTVSWSPCVNDLRQTKPKRTKGSPAGSRRTDSENTCSPAKQSAPYKVKRVVASTSSHRKSKPETVQSVKDGAPGPTRVRQNQPEDIEIEGECSSEIEDDSLARLQVTFRAWMERRARSTDPRQQRLRQLKLTRNLLSKVEECLYQQLDSETSD